MDLVTLIVLYNTLRPAQKQFSFRSAIRRIAPQDAVFCEKKLLMSRSKSRHRTCDIYNLIKTIRLYTLDTWQSANVAAQVNSQFIEHNLVHTSPVHSHDQTDFWCLIKALLTRSQTLCSMEKQGTNSVAVMILHSSLFSESVNISIVGHCNLWSKRQTDQSI